MSAAADEGQHRNGWPLERGIRSSSANLTDAGGPAGRGQGRKAARLVAAGKVRRENLYRLAANPLRPVMAGPPGGVGDGAITLCRPPLDA